MAKTYKNLPLSPETYAKVALLAEANGLGERGLGAQIEILVNRELPECNHKKVAVAIEYYPSDDILPGTPLNRAGFYCSTCKRVYAGNITSSYIDKKVEAGKEGMSGATVRGKMRLLDLPKPIAEKLSSGEISEGTARTLLSAQKLASMQDMLDALEEVKENPDESASYVINRFVSNMDHVKQMWSDDRRGGKPKSYGWGSNAWLLDMKKFPNQLLPKLTREEAIRALRVRGEERKGKDIDRAVSLIEGWVGNGGATIEGLVSANVAVLGELDAEYAVKLRHLLNPPACNVCPFYTVMDGDHLCGMKICHERKSKAWAAHRFEKMSKDLGMAIYQPEDGKYRLLDHYTEKHLFAKKNKDLRLLPKAQWGGHVYQGFDGLDSDLAWVVVTGETLKKRAVEKKQKREDVRSGMDLHESILENAAETLKWAVAREVQKMFEGFNQKAIELLFAAPYGWSRPSFLAGEEPTEEHAQFVLWMARDMVDQADDEDNDGFETAAQMAESLTKTCKALGIKAPRQLGKMALEFDAQLSAAGVSAETEA